jgi:hypothetical protein
MREINTSATTPAAKRAPCATTTWLLPPPALDCTTRLAAITAHKANSSGQSTLSSRSRNQSRSQAIIARHPRLRPGSAAAAA